MLNAQKCVDTQGSTCPVTVHQTDLDFTRASWCTGDEIVTTLKKDGWDNLEHFWQIAAITGYYAIWPGQQSWTMAKGPNSYCGNQQSKVFNEQPILAPKGSSSVAIGHKKLNNLFSFIVPYCTLVVLYYNDIHIWIQHIWGNYPVITAIFHLCLHWATVNNPHLCFWNTFV